MTPAIRPGPGDAPPTTDGSEAPLVVPDDAHNRALVGHVHPPRWENPTPRGRYNLVVIGAGTAGLVSAVGAAGLGAKVALVEHHLLGGDCLNVGCVPSKAILSAARAAAVARRAGEFGIHLEGVEVDFAAVMERMRRLRAGIAPHDSAARLKELGVDVYFGRARFVAPDAVEVGGRRLEFARAVIATGARAARLPIPGLEEAGYLTNETVFSLTALPRHLLVIGAGPIGCEMAQAFRRFGAEVTIISLDPQVLPREDPDAGAVLAASLEADGVELRLGAKIERVERNGNSVSIVFERAGKHERASGDTILVGVGRAPNVEGLELEAAGVAYDRNGVHVDERLRTTNRRIFAAGDICSRFKFTHAADAMARIAIQNALFFGRRRASALVIPWCTYTEPEVAHVGLTAAEARKRGGEVRTFTVPLAEVDRAVLEGAGRGFARVYTPARSDRILGATIVARHAGEMIGEVVLAMNRGLGLGALSSTIHPYPTQAEVLRKLGDAAQRARLTPRLRSAFAALMRLRRGWQSSGPARGRASAAASGGEV